MGDIRMKLVYICHPLTAHPTLASGDAAFTVNIQIVARLCVAISAPRPDVVPISPAHCLGLLPRACAGGNQEWAYDASRHLMSTCDEMWVFGPWRISTGCRREVASALNTYCIPTYLCGGYMWEPHFTIDRVTLEDVDTGGEDIGG
jgi:hypothetical protein